MYLSNHTRTNYSSININEYEPSDGSSSSDSLLTYDQINQVEGDNTNNIVLRHGKRYLIKVVHNGGEGAKLYLLDMYLKNIQIDEDEVIDEDDVKIITDLMMGGDGTNIDGELGELHLSAISEAMNQMCGRIATSMSELLHTPTDIGFPAINSKHKTTFEIPDELCNGSDIVVGLSV